MLNLRSLSFALAVPMLATVFMTGCGDPEVAKADVEKTAMTQLSASVGKPSPPITCPSGLKAKVGTKLVCAIDLDGKPYDVDITVTGVDGSTAKFDVEVAKTPRH